MTKRGPREAQERPKKAQDGPRWPKRGPREAQERPKMAKDGPREAPRWPKKGAREAQERASGPSWVQEPS